MSDDLDVRDDSLEHREGQTNTDLRIGQYGFFASGDENRYSIADEKSAEHLGELRDKPFTSAFSETGGTGADRVKTMAILENPNEYTKGLYDEVGGYSSDMLVPMLLIISACVVTFFITRLFYARKRRKAEECISQSQ